jgi:chaperonin cofactor prefoldin
MTSSHEAHEELGSRLDRLERSVRELSVRLSRAERRGGSAMSRISFVGWLQISGPTFAAMVFGFALLWNAQQMTSAQVLDLGRTLGRLEGSIDGVDRSLEALDSRIETLDIRMGTLDSRIEKLGASVERLGERISELGPS